MSDKPPLAWIVESKNPSIGVYLTHKPDVAEKREKAGDIVTPYHSKVGERTAAPATTDDEEL